MTGKQLAVKEKTTYCLVCKKKTNSDEIGVLLQNKIAIQKSKCTVYDSKESTFLKRINKKNCTFYFF